MSKSFGVASDHAGLELKQALARELAQRGHTPHDFGTVSSDSCDYPDFAHAVAEAIARGEIERALLVCGTGVGMSIAANRHPAVRAVVCSEPFSARMARRHNDANVLCLGARVVGVGAALEVLEAFLGSEFEGGRHAARVAKIRSAVKLRATPVFQGERARFALRFTCEHCSYFQVEAERCSHGYPNREHRAAHYEVGPEPSLLFCKDFDLI